jgi:hypothetical protein
MTDRDLTILLCQLLGTVPGWHWNPTAGTPSGVGVFYGSIPERPDQAIGVRVYGGSDDAVVYEPQRRVQLRIRGARGRPDGADELAAVAFTVLQGARPPGVSWIERTSFGPLGADTNGREERTDNYLISLDNQEATH